MEVGNTIRNLRTAKGMSQEELAEKVYVSRQTISNWENDKSYPDVQSLAIVADLFDTTIDSLVKGDLPMIETRIEEAEVRMIKRNTMLYAVLLIVSIVVMAISFAHENWLALTTGAIVYAIAMYFASMVEQDKKNYAVQTYREIKALLDGAGAEEIEALREQRGKDSSVLAKLLVGAGTGVVVGLAVALVMKLLG